MHAFHSEQAVQRRRAHRLKILKRLHFYVYCFDVVCARRTAESEPNEAFIRMSHTAHMGTLKLNFEILI